MKISLRQQIEEIEREIGLREGVYARAVAAGKMRQSISDYHMARIKAALATLRYVEQHADAIRAAVLPPDVEVA